jgi:hypothetical protein
MVNKWGNSWVGKSFKLLNCCFETTIIRKIWKYEKYISFKVRWGDVQRATAETCSWGNASPASEPPEASYVLPKLLICCHVLLLEEFTASHIRTSQTKIPDFSSQFKSMDTGLDLFILHMEIHYCVCRNTCNMFVHACKPEGNLSS